MSSLLNIKPYIKTEAKKLDPLLHFNIKEYKPETIPVLKISNNSSNIELTDLILTINNKQFKTKDFDTLGDFFIVLLDNGIDVKVINNPALLHLPFLSVVNFNTYKVESIQGLKSPTSVKYFNDLSEDILEVNTEYLVLNAITAEPIESEVINNNIYYTPNFYASVVRKIMVVSMYINISLDILKHTEKVY